MGKLDRYKEIKKLINAGHPLYVGLGFMLAAIYVLVKLGVSLLWRTEGDNEMGIGTIAALAVLATVAILIGVGLIKVGMESKDEEESRNDS